MPPPRTGHGPGAAEPRESVLELSVRVIRDDGHVPFESKVNIPIGDGRDWKPAFQSWVDMMASAVAIHRSIRPAGEGDGGR